MTKSFLKHTRSLRRILYVTVALSSTLLITGCNGWNKSAGNEETETHDDHADNDIAMTLRSIIDAVKVGEPLDSAQYNFTGTLTDGSGRPL